MARPFIDPIFEDLVYAWTNIMFGIQPRESLFRMKWRRPLKASVWLEFHAEQWIGKAGKVIIVDASINKGCMKTNLQIILVVFPANAYTASI